jgi:hypothetical protein
VDQLQRVLCEGLPETFFPSPAPFTTRDGCTVQLLTSVQGMCTTWHPDRTDMPEIEVCSKLGDMPGSDMTTTARRL